MLPKYLGVVIPTAPGLRHYPAKLFRLMKYEHTKTTGKYLDTDQDCHLVISGRFSFLSEQVGANKVCPTPFTMTSDTTLQRVRQLRMCDGRCIRLSDGGHRFRQMTFSVMNPQNGSLDMYLTLNVTGLHCNDRRLVTVYHTPNSKAAIKLHQCPLVETVEFAGDPGKEQCTFLCPGIYSCNHSTVSSHGPTVSIRFENMLDPPTTHIDLCGIAIAFT